MFRGWTEESPDAFLDTIPEDQSVAQQQLKNLSAASAVASSDSEVEVGDEIEVMEGQHIVGPPKSRRAGSVASSSNGAIIGTAETPRGDASSSFPGASSPDRSFKANGHGFRRWWCGALWLFLLAGLSVGVYFIVKHSTEGQQSGPSSSSMSRASSSIEPTMELTFPPGVILDLSTEAPTISPTSMHVEDIDDILLKISTSESYFDPSTPQGTCRNWLWKEDQRRPIPDAQGELYIKQRYILCVLYETTQGGSWISASIPFRDPSLHECDWLNVGCDADAHIATLYLNDRNLQGSIPSELVHLSDLQLLSLGENELTGSIPEGILELPKLMFIDMSSNKLVGTIPSTAASPTTPGRYSPLEVLYLDGNRLEGTVPFFDTLSRMRVQRNLFTGFDPGYTTLQSLTSWKMYDNRLQGTLPQEWNTPNLTHVDLALNQWTGTIPESLWNLPSLESLSIHDAQLTGTLPSRTASTSWKYLLLFSNQLTGTLPPSLGEDWNKVVSIMLHNNSLVGAITDDQCEQWPLMERLELDCLRSEVQCACCTVCHP